MRADQRRLMFALDMGTTTLEGRFVDQGGNILASAVKFNPQQAFGQDIISRLEKAKTAEGMEQLRTALMRGVAEVFATLCGDTGIKPATVRRAVAAGNAAVSVMARGGNVASLLRPPYRPDSCAGVDLQVSGLDVPMYLLPLVGGYVGGDLLAVLYALDDPAPGSLVVDVGTNAEMALFDGNGWVATSVAAGPAFEGGNISCGIPAQPGAVSGVHVENQRFRIDTVSAPHAGKRDMPPLGLCGSGVMETIVTALEHGLVGRDGTIADPDMVDTNLARYIGHQAGWAGTDLQGSPEREQAYVRVYRDARVDLRLTQDDIRQFQLAKGAVYAGAECLMQRTGVEPGALEHVYITGALGGAITPEMLRRIALLPDYMIKKVEFVQDGVLRGLVRYLQRAEGSMEVERLRAQIQLYPLSGTPAFERAFVNALNF